MIKGTNIYVWRQKKSCDFSDSVLSMSWELRRPAERVQDERKTGLSIKFTVLFMYILCHPETIAKVTSKIIRHRKLQLIL